MLSPSVKDGDGLHADGEDVVGVDGCECLDGEAWIVAVAFDVEIHVLIAAKNIVCKNLGQSLAEPSLLR